VTSALPALFILASMLGELVVFGLFMVGTFVIVVLANFVAEYRFSRVLVGEGLATRRHSQPQQIELAAGLRE